MHVRGASIPVCGVASGHISDSIWVRQNAWVCRAGIIPLDNTSDIAGPLARSVEDVARMLEVLVAVDPNDPLTSLSKFLGSKPANYTSALSRDALKVVFAASSFSVWLIEGPKRHGGPCLGEVLQPMQGALGQCTSLIRLAHQRRYSWVKAPRSTEP